MLDVIAAILIIFAAMLTYMHHHLDFTNITEPFEKLQSIAQEQFPGIAPSADEETVEATETTSEGIDLFSNIRQLAEQMRNDLGITQAQMYYIKFKTFMESLEQKVTKLPFKPLIVLGVLIFFALKSFVGIVPVSATCLIAAVLFPFPTALLINLIGVGIIFTIKYAMGYNAKSNAIKKFIMKSDRLWNVVSDADNSTKKVLKETSDKRKSQNKLKELEKEERAAMKGGKPHPVLKKIKKALKTVKKTLLKVPVLSTLIDEEDAVQSAKGGTGNPIILFAMRLIPFVPANPISSLYGNMQMDYRSFLAISLVGYLIKVTSFTAIGYNIADPFSSKFIVPLIALLYLSGFLLFAINRILKFVDKRKQEQAAQAASEPAAGPLTETEKTS
ncbi:MAG: hypothetical protein J5847_04815 [Clostridia bacterium]|nr:hypothetical protein [Clostridia bacterium]